MANALSVFRNNRFGINSMSMHEVTSKLGIVYSGDVSLEHGGMFYETSNWAKYGYASVVRVDVDSENVYITIGSINKTDDLADCLRTCGMALTDEGIVTDSGDIIDEHQRLLVEIEATESRRGIEPEQSKVCKLHTAYGPMGREYFVDDKKHIAMDDLQGYVLSQYVLPHLN